MLLSLESRVAPALTILANPKRQRFRDLIFRQDSQDMDKHGRCTMAARGISLDIPGYFSQATNEEIITRKKGQEKLYSGIMSNKEESQPKKLKFSDPDLKVTVGDDDDERREHWHHAVVMAKHSNYIDTMLSTPMKESKNLEISFPDIAPETWTMMISFLEDPLAACDMTVADAMQVTKFYEKYDFPKGRQLCDRVLERYIEKNENSPDLDILIDVILLADTAHLETAKETGVKVLRDRFRSLEKSILFTEEQIQRLVPLIAKEETLMSEIFDESGLPAAKAAVSSPLFAPCLVHQYSARHSETLLKDAVTGVTLCNFGSDLDGRYKVHQGETGGLRFVQKGLRTAQVKRRYVVKLVEGAWEIESYTYGIPGPAGNTSVVRTRWRCPNSGNMVLPPRTGWIPVDSGEAHGDGEPRVGYIYTDIASW